MKILLKRIRRWKSILISEMRMKIAIGKIKAFKHKERFKAHKINLLGLTFHTIDPLAFFFEFIYIFKNNIYAFKTEKKDPFIIDGGGYIGTSVLFFKQKYPDAKVMVFEPDRRALSLLYKNIQENGLRSVEVVEAGLSSFNGIVNFKPDDTDGGKITEKDGIKIPVKKLSGYIDQEVDFLKLNIEGSELAVFQDLDQSEKIKLIKELCFEWHSFARERQNLDKILKILTDNNFRYYISIFEGMPVGNFSGIESDNFYLLVYAKKQNH